MISDAKPNILFILTDQQSASMMGCSGNPFVRTPSMDSLAGEGIRFERAYCANPVCIPSRFSLMTGLLPSAIGLRSNDTTGIDKVPDYILRNGTGHLLRRAGYRPFYGGKQHLPKMSVSDLGFEIIENSPREQLAERCERFFSKPTAQPWALFISFINPHDICYMALRDFAENSESDRQILDAARVPLASLDEALKESPGEDYPPLPDNFEVQNEEPHAISALLRQRPFRMNARQNWTEEKWILHRKAYTRLTEMVDRQIGRVLSALELGGEADNTAVIFSSDHGDMGSSHRMEHKTALYEECCRVPFILKWPGHVRGGTVNRSLVSNGLDLLPTICDIAGCPVPEYLNGTSVLSLPDCRGCEKEREYVPVESEIGRGVWGRDYAYVKYDMPGYSEQLYDLNNDPGQMHNVLYDRRHQESAVKMRQIFDDFFA